MHRSFSTCSIIAVSALAACSGPGPETQTTVDAAGNGGEPMAEAAGPRIDPQTFLPVGGDGWEVPRTPWGDPDLQGTWPINHLTGVPLQRDPQFGERRYMNDDEMSERIAQYEDRNTRYENEVGSNELGMGHWVEWGDLNRLTSLIVDPPNGRLPALTAEGERRRALMRSGWMEDIPFDHYTDFDNWDRCITRGLPASMLPSYYNAGIQILQTPGWVAIRLEMIHEVRLVRLAGEPVDENSRAWLGYSMGHWEGDTLVVETTNFNGEGSSTNIHTIGSPPFNNTPISHEYVLTERFTPTGPDTITYQATVHDPVVWTEPWTVELPWVRDDSYRFFEYACAEDNTMVRNYITSSRAERGLPPVEE